MGWTTAVPTNIKYASGAEAQAVSDLSMTADSSGNLWVGFRAAGTETLYVARYSNGAWSQAMTTNQTSEWGPALVWSGGTLYMFWNYGDSTIHYGSINNKGACTDLGKIEDPTGSSVAETNSSPAGIAWNGSMWCSHLGWGLSDTIYESQYSDSQWGDDTEVPQQSSCGSPLYAATSDYQFLFHRGSFNTNYVWWSVKDQATLKYSTNETIPDLWVAGGASRGFGAAAFGDNNVVVVSSFGTLQWTTCSINSSEFQWSFQGNCGKMVGGSQAPGMCYLNGMMYMVYADESTDQLYMTTLSSLP